MATTKPLKPVEGKLYWIKVLGHKQWFISLYREHLWHIPGDPNPWGAVKEMRAGPEPPEEV